MAVSSWLEQPFGQYITHSVVSIAPAVAVALAAANKTETSIKLVATGFSFLILVIGRMFWICGISLMKAIDESLRKSQQANNGEPKERGGVRNSTSYSSGGGGSGPGPPISGAKRKVKHMMIFTGLMSAISLALMCCVIFSKYGTVAPLPLFVGPMFFMSPAWIAVNIQLHAGRTKRRDTRDGMLSIAVRCTSAGAVPKHHIAQVVPVRGIASAP